MAQPQQQPRSFDNITTGALGEYPAGTWDNISLVSRPLPLDENEFSTPFKCAKLLEKANPLAAASGKWTRNTPLAEIKLVVKKFVYHANFNQRLWRISTGLEGGDEAALKQRGVVDADGNTVWLPGENVVKINENDNEIMGDNGNNGNNNNNNNNNNIEIDNKEEEKQREIERERERKLDELRAAIRAASGVGRNNNNNNQRVMF